MSLVPSFFGKLGLAAREIFDPKKNSIKFKNVFEHKHRSGDVTWKSSATLSGDSVTNAVKSTYKGKDVKVEAEAKTDDQLTVKVSTGSLADGLDATVEAGYNKKDGDARKTYANLSFEYARDHFAGDLEAEYNHSANSVDIEASGVVGYDGLALGGQVSVKNGLGESEEAELDDFNFAVNYDYNADTTISLKSKNKADNLTASFHHVLSSDATFGAQINYDLNSSNFGGRIGGTYKIDGDSSIKAFVDSDSFVNAQYSHRLSSRAKIAVSSQLKATDFGKDTQKHKLGFKLSLGDF